jgi:hypothetical protein
MEAVLAAQGGRIMQRCYRHRRPCIGRPRQTFDLALAGFGYHPVYAHDHRAEPSLKFSYIGSLLIRRKQVARRPINSLAL